MDESLKNRRKRLGFRSWRRGTRELDLLLGPFADARLEALDADQLDAYEELLEAPDRDLQGWISGAATAPPDVPRNMIRLIKDFSNKALKR